MAGKSWKFIPIQEISTKWQLSVTSKTFVDKVISGFSWKPIVTCWKFYSNLLVITMIIQSSVYFWSIFVCIKIWLLGLSITMFLSAACPTLKTLQATIPKRNAFKEGIFKTSNEKFSKAKVPPYFVFSEVEKHSKCFCKKYFKMKLIANKNL